MTKKDYELIAAVLRDTAAPIGITHIRGECGQVSIRDTLAADFAKVLIEDNPRFNAERFIKAVNR